MFFELITIFSFFRLRFISNQMSKLPGVFVGIVAFDQEFKKKVRTYLYLVTFQRYIIKIISKCEANTNK